MDAHPTPDGVNGSASMLDAFLNLTVLLDVAEGVFQTSRGQVAGIMQLSLLDWTRTIVTPVPARNGEPQTYQYNAVQERWKILSALALPNDFTATSDPAIGNTLWVSLDFLLALLARGDVALANHMQCMLLRLAFPERFQALLPIEPGIDPLPVALGVQRRYPSIQTPIGHAPIMWARFKDLHTVATYITVKQPTLFGLSAPVSSSQFDLITALDAGGSVQVGMQRCLLDHWRAYLSSVHETMHIHLSYLHRAAFEAPNRAAADTTIILVQLEKLSAEANHLQYLISNMQHFLEDVARGSGVVVGPDRQ